VQRRDVRLDVEQRLGARIFAAVACMAEMAARSTWLAR